MKATDSALNAYQTTKSLDTLRKAEYGLYGITSANGLGEYVTGKDMFGNELSEEQRERSLNEALAFLGGNVAGVGLRKASPYLNVRNEKGIPVSEYKNLRNKTPNNEIRKMVNPDGPKKIRSMDMKLIN